MINLTDKLKVELYKVNGEINDFPYKTDTQRWGTDEFWDFIDAYGGDCFGENEKFWVVANGATTLMAITKMWRLVKLGWPREDLRLATCWAVPGDDTSYHCVLTVETNTGTLVLDNMTNSIRQWNLTGYQWHKRERPGQRQWELLS